MHISGVDERQAQIRISMPHRHRRGFDHASQRFERLGKPILLFAERSDFELAFSRVEYPQNHPAWAGQASSCRCRSEEHTSELQSLMRISSSVFCLKKKKKN